MLSGATRLHPVSCFIHEYIARPVLNFDDVQFLISRPCKSKNLNKGNELAWFRGIISTMNLPVSPKNRKKTHDPTG